MKNKTFTCEGCKKKFIVILSTEEEKKNEMLDNFGYFPSEDEISVICDNCYQFILNLEKCRQKYLKQGEIFRGRRS